jgi:cytidylate kinase
MIITISGKPGSGKSTVAKIISKKLKLKHYSTGDYYRGMAEKRGLSVLELAKLAEEDKSIDKELDSWQKKLGKKENDFIIDARLGFHFIPNSVKIYLDGDETTRAKRIFRDKVRKEKNLSLKESINNMKAREKSEQLRFLDYYKVDSNDQSHYDLVVDTTNMDADGIVNEIVDYVISRE